MSTSRNTKPAPHGPVCYIGCAGWSIATQYAGQFKGEGSYLERYATRFNAVEIDSSFYRSHKAATYARWAQSVPRDFRFAVKLPRLITHFEKLRAPNTSLKQFFVETASLEEKLGCVLVQLPPSLDFNLSVAAGFLKQLRKLYFAMVAIEPRNQTWFAPDVDALLCDFEIARVAADPPTGDPQAASSGGSPQSTYKRLHGSPKIYYSSYSKVYLRSIGLEMKASTAIDTAWCIFDNTAIGAATGNALALTALVKSFQK